jgi:hypothetical protein
VVAQARDILRKRTGRVPHHPPHLPAANLAPSVRGEGGAEGARDEAMLPGSFEAAAASVRAVEKLGQGEVGRERGGERGEGAGVSGKEGGGLGAMLKDAGFEQLRLRVVDLVTADATKLQRFQLLCHACRVGRGGEGERGREGGEERGRDANTHGRRGVSVVCDVEEEVVAKTTPGGRVVGKAQILKSSLYDGLI